jgi:hypothetical protein
MFKRHLKTFALILFMLLGYGLSLLPLMLVRPHLQVQLFLSSFLIWLLLVVLSLPFILRAIIRKAWFFKGRGEPVIMELLESMLMGINDFDSPVFVRKKRGRLLLSWRCSDPHWGERMALKGVKNNYELRLIFDENTRTVRMLDRVRSVNFNLSPIKIKFGFFTKTKFFWRIKTGPQWGLQNFKNTSADKYQFKPQEIKSPVFNAIIANGWNIRFDLFYMSL